MRNQAHLFKRYFGKVVKVLPRPAPNAFDRACGRSRGDASLVVSAAFIVLYLLIWELLSGFRVISNVYFPQPSMVLEEVFNFLGSMDFYGHVVASLRRIAVGFSFGILIGGVLGVLAGSHWVADAAISPIMSVVYNIPKFAFLPFFMITFGLTDLMHYLFITFAVSIVQFRWTYITAIGAKEDYIRAALVDGAGRMRIVLSVLLKPSASVLIYGAEIALSAALSAMLYVEINGVSEGIGFLNQTTADLFQIRKQLAILMIIGLMATVFHLVMTWLRNLAAKNWPADY